MARPRLYSLDDLLDVAERLVTSGDPAGLTLRALASSAGASNGTIYVTALGAEQKRLRGVLIALAEAVWARKDRIAVEAIAACVVDIPGGLLRRPLLEGRGVDAATERRIAAAVCAVLATPLDPLGR